ncbi:hypothetical protein GOV08_04010 [Candidatus Woesearchaeota archaeon]|nr:hypothetical protein [Candidatus Woesearchaeota archaeon]
MKLLDEFKNSFRKELWPVFGKDILLFVSLFALLILNFLILTSIFPDAPGFTQETILQASQLEVENVTIQLQKFMITLFLLAIILSLIGVGILTVIKEWSWAGLLGKKPEFKDFFGFYALKLILLFIAGVIGYFALLITGFILQKLADIGMPVFIVGALTLLVIIFLVPTILHIINFATYDYLKKRKIVPSLKSVYNSFRKCPKLFWPHMIVGATFIVLGTISNQLFNSTSNLLIGLGLLLFVFFISWQKVYFSLVFKRLYN